MEIGAKVKAVSGDYTGYYGEVVEVVGDFARVSHKEGFGGLLIAFADLEQVEND